MGDSLGDRMKDYERVNKTQLMRRVPAIIRIDGKAFHSWTKGLDRPFDKRFYAAMAWMAQRLVNEIQGAVFAYGQSDELSILLRDYDERENEAWFKGNIQKIASVSASLATGYFNEIVPAVGIETERLAFFDARVFALPQHEVVNYYIWRQQDFIRNSIQSVGQTFLGHKACQGINNQLLVDKLREMDEPIDWYHDIEPLFRYGYSYERGAEEPIFNLPVFTECREFIEVHVQKQV